MTRRLTREQEIELAWRQHDAGRKRYGSEHRHELTRLAGEQNWRCCWCQQPMEIADASIEHIVPRSLGGPDVLDNIAIAHRDCNSRRPSTYDELLRLAALMEIEDAF